MQAQLTNRCMSVICIGAVSYMKLVSTTDNWAVSDRPLIDDLGISRRFRAVSILANLSLRFEPNARVTEWNDGESFLPPGSQT